MVGVGERSGLCPQPKHDSKQQHFVATKLRLNKLRQIYFWFPTHIFSQPFGVQVVQTLKGDTFVYACLAEQFPWRSSDTKREWDPQYFETPNE